MFSTSISQRQFKDWLVDNSSSWHVAGTIRSPFKLNSVKLEKYSNSIMQYNSSILSILYVIESDSDPYDRETGEESYITNKIEIGTHAHLLVNTGGKSVRNPVKMDIFKNQPYWIPYWKEKGPKAMKAYVKYNIPKIQKTGENWGLVLQE